MILSTTTATSWRRRATERECGDINRLVVETHDAVVDLGECRPDSERTAIYEELAPTYERSSSSDIFRPTCHFAQKAHGYPSSGFRVLAFAFISSAARTADSSELYATFVPQVLS